MKVGQTDGTTKDEVVLTGSNPTEGTATIANGASVSNMVDLGAKTLVAIIMPATWTAANLTFQVSRDGATGWKDVYDTTGTEKNIVAAADRYIPTNIPDWVGVRYVRVRSGTAAVPVNQTASAAIILVTKAV